MDIKTLVQVAYENSKKHGWYDGGPRNIPEMIALMHSELSEMLEDYRDGKMDLTLDAGGKPIGFPSELADVFIRGADLAGFLGIDLEKAVTMKHAYNLDRPHRHGGKVC